MASDADCIFCKIVGGKISCYRVYEDDHILSFLDVGPLTHGHTLVIPKAHYVTLDTMPTELTQACMAAVSQVGRAVMAAVNAGEQSQAGGWNVLQNNGEVAGQVVQHVHFHIIPRVAGDGLGYRWPAGKLEQADAKHLVVAITKSLI